MKRAKPLYVLTCMLATLFFTACIHEELEECSSPSTLRLLLELPSPHLPDYTKASSQSEETGYDLRCVIDIFSKETGKKITHQRVTPIAVAGQSGVYSVVLSLEQGEYNIHLWTDYVPHTTTDDYHYTTENLKLVGFNPARDYIGGTDSRDAAYSVFSVALTEETTEERVVLQRPFAKYRIIATDTERYYKLMATGDYPSPDKLIVTISYENFLPSSFNLLSGSPNDASTGITYSCNPSTLESRSSVDMQIASDWVMANREDTFVRVTISITDREGNLISRIPGVKINYRRNHLTTIRGHFLTAGKSTGNIHIDTEWEGEYIIEF